MLAFGLIFGAVSAQAKDMTGYALEWYTRMGGTDQIVDAYLTSMIAMAGMTVAIYALQVLLRMRAEEADGPWSRSLPQRSAGRGGRSATS
jgi:ABC-2 type transport system permease protein